MAKKDSFILYTEQKAVIDKLSDEQAGKLIKAIYEYVETGEMPKLDNVLDLVITPFKTILDKDKVKYEEVSKARAEAGSRGGKQNQAKKAIANKSKQKKQLQTKGSNCDDNDNDNEYDNDNDLEKEKSKRKAFTPPTLEEVEKYVAEKKLKVNAKNFYDYFTVGNWIDKNGNKVKNWKQKILTWNSYADTGKEEKITQREYSEDDFSELYANNKKE